MYSLDHHGTFSTPSPPPTAPAHVIALNTLNGKNGTELTAKSLPRTPTPVRGLNAHRRRLKRFS
jgi:hypothetical protein